MGRKRKGKRGRFKDYYIFMFAFGITVFMFAIVSYPEAVGLNPVVGTNLLGMLPTILLTCIGIYMVSHSSPQGNFLGMVSLGIGLALFLDEADAIGIISTQMLTGLTLLQTQTWVMALSMIFGAILFSSRN